MTDATPLLRAYAGRRRRQLARLDTMVAQRATLTRLLWRARATRFGIAHGFATIDSVSAYQRRVPLRGYEAFWAEWWQPEFPILRDVTWPGRIRFFAETSGTSAGITKFIPVSGAMIRANRRAALETLVYHLAGRPNSRILAGRAFLLGGSTALRRLAPDVRSGDLSGIAAATTPWWARGHSFPPRRLALLADWATKIAALAAAAPRHDIRSISGTPSWMLVLFEQLAALHPQAPPRLASWFPRLEMLVHGGVGFAPYRERFAAWLAGSTAETREVYPASEGFIAVADRGPDEGLRMLVDNGLFFEFVPLAELHAAHPTRHWLGDAEPGVEYALALTSNAGLWSYLLGDTVRLLSRDPPRLLVTGRSGQELSVFGEHLTAAELDAAIAAAAHALGCTVSDYAAMALLDQPGGRGRHLFVVECDRTDIDPAAFASRLDATLAAGNADYAAHRHDAAQMLAPQIRLVPPGRFAAWMKRRGKLGGQNKVPRVIADPALQRDLLAFMDSA